MLMILLFEKQNGNHNGQKKRQGSKKGSSHFLAVPVRTTIKQYKSMRLLALPEMA